MIKYVVFDTETDGLNIRVARPFMCQYMYVDENLQEIEKGLFYFKHRDDDDKLKEERFRKVLSEVPTLVGANIKFDVHMLLNMGYPNEWFEHKNYIDVQVFARLVIPHDNQIDKTFTVALKKLAVRYLGRDCANEEHLLKMELSSLVQKHKQKMLEYFLEQGVIPYTTLVKERNVIISKVYGDAWYKNYQDFQYLNAARKKFLELYPAPTYEDVSNVSVYGLTDVILTHGLFKLWYPLVVSKGQVPALIRTSKATYPLIMMEREGLVIDIIKIINDRKFLIDFKRQSKIIDPRTGKEVSINQHEVLRQIYEYETGLKLSKADQTTRDRIADKSATARLVNSLTKLEKLINTYATKLLREVKVVDGEYKVFTQYSLSSTVTGRLSSDFQQFPKEPTTVGDRVINVRDWFVKPKWCKYMVYEDYAQQELKLQCEWSGLVNKGKPDINMCRASEPYECHQGSDGKWYLNEDPTKEWEPIDLHAMTAKKAFPGIDESHPDWKHYRKLGKRCNFASNYGASASKLSDALDVDMETAQRLVKGYRETFKGVVDYGNWIKNSVYTHDYLENLFHRRYYSRSPHQLKNWLVQGSGADILLMKLDELKTYLDTHPWWHFMISVHDEVGFAVEDIPRDQMVREAKEIQKVMEVQLCFVKVVTDIEVSDTTWANKVELEEYLQGE